MDNDLSIKWQDTEDRLAGLNSNLAEVQQIKDEATREVWLKPLRKLYQNLHYERIAINMEQLKRDRANT